jgi:hypothetical protein
MKQLLTGVAMAAALAIAAPAWAQTAPMTPSAPAKPAMAKPAKPASTTTMAKKPMKHHHMSHKMGSGDAMTEQLNQQELQRITSGGAAPMPASAAPMRPGGNNPTSGTAGPFAPAGSMSAPPPAK